MTARVACARAGRAPAGSRGRPRSPGCAWAGSGPPRLTLTGLVIIGVLLGFLLQFNDAAQVNPRPAARCAGSAATLAACRSQAGFLPWPLPSCSASC